MANNFPEKDSWLSDWNGLGKMVWRWLSIIDKRFEYDPKFD